MNKTLLLLVVVVFEFLVPLALLKFVPHILTVIFNVFWFISLIFLNERIFSHVEKRLGFDKESSS